jgi:hypothetical protein
MTHDGKVILMNAESRRDGPRRSAGKIAWRALALALLLSSCCVSGSIGLGRVSGFMEGVLEISADLNLEGFVDHDFAGGAGVWADVGSFDQTRVETDLSAAVFTQANIVHDVDDDVFEERISLLRAVTSAAVGGEVLFVSWTGDEYTVDKGVCYLGWLEGSEVKLAASYCEVNLGTMYCTANQSSDPRPSCETCDSDGMCIACDMGKSLDACLPPKSIGGSVDLDIDIDIDIDIDVATDDEPQEV